jgi:decaprenylphospho-beta-D-erythro-pentofuranosid-2-ulose 2-reductase
MPRRHEKQKQPQRRQHHEQHSQHKHRHKHRQQEANTKQEIIATNIKLLIEQLEAGHSDALTNYLTATRGAAYVDSAVANLDDTAIHPELLAHAVNSLAGLDIVFLALGVLGDQAKAESSFTEAAHILHTNLLAPISLLTWLGNYCAQRHSGTLAVLSSVAGERGRKSNYVYGSSKAGLTAFVDGLRNRTDREGVRVMTIKPGPVKTTMTAGMKGSAKFADVDVVAAALVKVIDGKTSKNGKINGPDIVYVPGIWRIIMAVIRSIPERIFKKLNL